MTVEKLSLLLQCNFFNEDLAIDITGVRGTAKAEARLTETRNRQLTCCDIYYIFKPQMQ